MRSADARGAVRALPLLLALLAGCASSPLPADDAVAPPAAAAPAGPTPSISVADAVAQLLGKKPAAPAPATAPPAPAAAAAAAPASAAAASTAVSAATDASAASPPRPKPRAPAASAPALPIDAATQQAFDDALTLQRAGRGAEAERGFATLAQARPDLSGPRANLALIHRRAGNLTLAASELDQAAAVSPAPAPLFNQLGIVWRELGDFTKAKAAYEAAIDADPAFAPATLNLGILHDLYLGDAPQALVLYERYLTLAGPAGDPAVSKWIAELKTRKEKK